MNSTAPTGDRCRPQRPPRRSPAAVTPATGCAICTPVLPPLIRIPFPAIDFDCGGARYRTRPIELVAQPIPCGGERGGNGEGESEAGGWRIEDGIGSSAAPAVPMAPATSPLPPSALATPHSAPFLPPGVRPPGPLGPPHPPISHPSSILYPPSSPRPASPYSLRRGLGAWRLIFAGREALLRPERGLLYVAWLLQHPSPQPIHGIDLAAQIPDLYRAQLGLPALADPATGHAAPLPSHARLQERSLALDDAHSLRALRRQEKELEALLDDDSQSEPVKAEALRDLEAIAAFLRQHACRSRDAAHRVVHAVREALRRFHLHLAAARDEHGSPHPVLRPFADHLKRHLLIPSARYAGRGGRYVRNDRAGCFTYEPPPGVLWS